MLCLHFKAWDKHFSQCFTNFHFLSVLVWQGNHVHAIITKSSQFRLKWLSMTWQKNKNFSRFSVKVKKNSHRKLIIWFFGLFSVSHNFKINHLSPTRFSVNWCYVSCSLLTEINSLFNSDKPAAYIESASSCSIGSFG